jgi:hypothetical protein
MNSNPNLTGYAQSDIEALYKSGSIQPTIDEYSNLIIENVKNKMFLSSISLSLQNMIYNSTKVETKLDPNFYEL